MYIIIIINIIYQNLCLYVNLTKTFDSQTIFEYFIFFWNTLFFNYNYLLVILCWLFVFYLYVHKCKIYLTIVLLLIFSQIYFTYQTISTDYLYFYYYKNELLINNINYIHPLCIYTVISSFLISYYHFNKSWFFILIFKYCYLSLKLLYFILILGCWWSYQEDLWNSWWSWEISEISNLIYLYIIILQIHRLNNYSQIIYLINWKNININLLAINYSLVQLYLSDSNHNFINYYSLTFLFSNIIIYNLLVLVLTVYFIFNLKLIKFFNFFKLIIKILSIYYFLYYTYIYNYWHLANQLDVLIFNLSFYYFYSLYVYIIILNNIWFKNFILIIKHGLFILFSTYLIYVFINTFNILNYNNSHNITILKIVFVDLCNNFDNLHQFKWLFINFISIFNICILTNLSFLILNIYFTNLKYSWLKFYFIH